MSGEVALSGDVWDLPTSEQPAAAAWESPEESVSLVARKMVLVVHGHLHSTHCAFRETSKVCGPTATPCCFAMNVCEFVCRLLFFSP